MTLIGTDEAQQRAKSLIEELLIDRNISHQNVESDQRRETDFEQKKQEIDWNSFDWVKANEEYVCFACYDKFNRSVTS